MIEILFALFVALQLADFVTTLAGLKAGHSTRGGHVNMNAMASKEDFVDAMFDFMSTFKKRH